MKKPVVLLIRNAAAQDFGGAERLPIFIAKGVEDFGYSPIIVTGSKKMLEFAQQNDQKVVKSWWWHYQNWSGVRALLTPIYLVWQLILTIYYLCLFIRYRPSIVHLQSKDDFIAGTIAGRLLGARVVWSDYADLKHIWKNLTVWYKNPVGRLIYWCAHLAHSISVVSESEKKLVSENLHPGDRTVNRLTVIYVGIEDRNVVEIARETDQIIFCAASRIVTDKGIGELLAAFEMLRKENSKVRLWILGDGPEREKFNTGHEAVTFYGHVDDPLSMVKAADVFVLPTYHEGFSVALVETSMLGKAVIATSVGGNVEIIQDRQTGLLVPPKDAESLFHAMRSLTRDQKLRNSLAKNLRAEYEQRFKFSTMIKDGILPFYGYEKDTH